MTLTLVLELKDVPILILCCLIYSFTHDACSRFASLGGEPKAVEGREKPFNRCYAKHSAHCCPSVQFKVCCCHLAFSLSNRGFLTQSLIPVSMACCCVACANTVCMNNVCRLCPTDSSKRFCFSVWTMYASTANAWTMCMMLTTLLADHRRIRYRQFILQFGCLGTTKCVELWFDAWNIFQDLLTNFRNL